MIDWISGALASSNSNQITEQFFIVTLIAAAFALYRISANPNGGYAQYAPTLLTTIGIFGTFLGITIGLLQFDPTSMETIDASMPALLGGMKLAFLTSIFGMGSSVVVKAWSLAVARTRAPKDSRTADVIGLLQAQHDALKDVRSALSGEGDSSVVTQMARLRTEMVDVVRNVQAAISPGGTKSLGERLDALMAESKGVGKLLLADMGKLTVAQSEISAAMAHSAAHLESIKKGIAGEGDTSVVTQIQKARTDLRDESEQIQQKLEVMRNDAAENARGLQAELKSFAEKVSELGSKALIEALSDVIKDFNRRLTEQFGDNFRRLDESVQKLVTWQDQYRQQMADMKAAMDKSAESVQNSEHALAGVREHASSIPAAIGQLTPIIVTIQGQLDDLARHLDALAEVRDKARDAVPEIRHTLERSFQEMRDAVTVAGEHYRSLQSGTQSFVEKYLEDMDSSRRRFHEGSEQWLDLVSTTLKDGAGEIEKTTQQTSKQLSEAAKAVAESAGSAGRDLEKALSGLKENSERTVRDFGTAMQNANENLRQDLMKIYQEQRTLVLQIGEDLRKENQKAATDRTALINKEIEQLDQAIAEELQQVLQRMGNGLGSITEKFSRDYSALTEQMQKVVVQARRGAEQ